MNRANDYLRSFGMSGFLITDEIKRLEQQLKIELGHGPRTPDQNPLEYYPQFEKEIRAEASEMAGHYELFYCLEQSIRKLISDTLLESSGPDWWGSGKIPTNIFQAVKERAQKEADSGVTRRSDAAIDYTTFGELSTII